MSEDIQEISKRHTAGIAECSEGVEIERRMLGYTDEEMHKLLIDELHDTQKAKEEQANRDSTKAFIFLGSMVLVIITMLIYHIG